MRHTRRHDSAKHRPVGRPMDADESIVQWARRDVWNCKRREPNEISAPRRASAEREGAVGLGPLACMHACMRDETTLMQTSGTDVLYW